VTIENQMVFNGEPSIGIPPWKSAFSENDVCDLDLWTDDTEDIISVMWNW